MTGLQQKKFSYYKIARKEGWDIITESSSSYDKAIISLSTASFGFISALVKFSPNPLICKSFLIVILVMLILSIFCSLLSFWFDQLFGSSLVKYAEKYFNEKNGEEYKNDWSYYASIVTKILSGAFFFFGLVLFSILFYINL